MLVMVLNMPEQCSFQDLLFHLFFMPKYAEQSASRIDISLLADTLAFTNFRFQIWNPPLCVCVLCVFCVLQYLFTY